MQTLTDLVATAQDRWIETVASWQEPVVEGLRSWSGTVDGILPSGLTERLPQPAAWARRSFELAEKSLHAQRDLVVQLLDAATPAAAGATEPAASSAS